MKINNINVFNKNEEVYTLLFGQSNPNLFFLTKCKIIEILYDKRFPKYVIQVLDMYDDIKFIKKYFFKTNFRYASKKSKIDTYRFEYNAVYAPNRLRNIAGLTTKHEILNLLQGKEDYTTPRGRVYKNADYKHFFIIESPYCFNTKKDMLEAYVQITNYHITRHFQQIIPYLFRDEYVNDLDSIYDVTEERFKEVIQDLMYQNKYNDKTSILKDIFNEQIVKDNE